MDPNFNLPPGVTLRDIEEHFGSPKNIPCEACGCDIPYYDDHDGKQPELCVECKVKSEEL